jgi:integrase
MASTEAILFHYFRRNIIPHYVTAPVFSLKYRMPLSFHRLMLDHNACQTHEKQRSLTCDSLRKKVTPHSGGWDDERVSIYAANGARKYLNHGERSRALAAIHSLEEHQSLFALVLAWTGARVSEVLALTPRSFQIESGLVTIVTLKRRKLSVREVPIPPDLMQLLGRTFDLDRLQKDECAGRARLWAFCRMTAWRVVRRVMSQAQIVGPQACPKGFRHGFGVCSLHSGVPINLVQRWMGHARLETTAIYLNVCGPEELAFARRFWNTSPHKNELDPCSS